MNTNKKLAVIIPVSLITVIILVVIGISVSNVRASCDQLLGQVNADKDKIHSWSLQIDQEKLSYSKEWFPTTAETNQLDQQVAEYNTALNQSNTEISNYNMQCVAR